MFWSDPDPIIRKGRIRFQSAHQDSVFIDQSYTSVYINDIDFHVGRKKQKENVFMSKLGVLPDPDCFPSLGTGSGYFEG